MSGYIGKVTIDNGSVIPVGSTLYGVCNTIVGEPAKEVPLTDASLGAIFDTLIDGITIHVKFTNGNIVNSGLTLKVGNTLAKPILNAAGTYKWPANTVIAFTYDGANWAVNSNIATDATAASNNYDSTSTNAISGQGVLAALQTLDGSITGTAGAGKTLSALSETDGVVTATFTDIAISNTQVSGLGDAAVKGVDTAITDSSVSTDVPTSSAVVTYVTNKTAGLTGAMHFKGDVGSTFPVGTAQGTYDTYEAGDVILFQHQEYVYKKGADAAHSEWILLGDEGSYALKTNTETVVKTASLTPNTLPQLTITATSIPNVTNVGTASELETEDIVIPKVTSAGSAMSATVASGVLQINTGSAATLDSTPITVKSVKTWSAGSTPTLGTAISVGSASGWDAGTQASLNQTGQTVVVP